MFRTPTNRRLFVLGIVTILMSVMALVNNLIQVEFEQSLSLGAIALSMLVFVWAYLFDREAYAAIGAYVMLAILGIVAMTTWFKLDGAIVPSVILGLVAIPFIFAWFNRQQNWGMLIPAYVLLAIIPIFYIGENSVPELVPAYVLSVIALPFLVAYLFSRKWAWLIPSAILFGIALSFVGVAFGLPVTMMNVGLPLVALLIGLYLLWRAATDQAENKQKN